MPSHSSREVLVIFGSLTTCDPGDISSTISLLSGLNIRVSIIGLSAEVFIFKKICAQTKGRYSVALEESHLTDLIMSHVIPPPSARLIDSAVIKMGFPSRRPVTSSTCLCHLDTTRPSNAMSVICPQCLSEYCELPIECKVCGLTLVSASHLARSYHHLFPVKKFVEKIADSDERCFACNSTIHKNVYLCETCQKLFCLDCDIFIHDILHSCPGCASTPSTASNTNQSVEQPTESATL